MVRLAFVRHLAAASDKNIAIAKKLIDAFVRDVLPLRASEQVSRAAKTFALITVAGELATKCGVTPWAEGEAWRAAVWAFNQWVERRGGTGSYEEQQVIDQVRLIIERDGEARFEPIGGSVRDVPNRLGWRKGDGAEREWWVPPETFKSEFCDGLDPKFVARTLAARGMLRKQAGKNLQCVVAFGKNQRTRAYVLTSKVLACEDEDSAPQLRVLVQAYQLSYIGYDVSF